MKTIFIIAGSWLGKVLLGLNWLLRITKKGMLEKIVIFVIVELGGIMVILSIIFEIFSRFFLVRFKIMFRLYIIRFFGLGFWFFKIFFFVSILNMDWNLKFGILFLFNWRVMLRWYVLYVFFIFTEFFILFLVVFLENVNFFLGVWSFLFDFIFVLFLFEFIDVSRMILLLNWFIRLFIWLFGFFWIFVWIILFVW